MDEFTDNGTGNNDYFNNDYFNDDNVNNDNFQPGPPTTVPPSTVPPQQPQTNPNRRSRKVRGTARSNNIKELGTVDIPANTSNIHCLTIIGQIEGHLVMPAQNKTTKYEHIIPQLIAIEQNDDIEGVIVVLNTVGGDVEAGLAIAEMLVSMSKPTVSLVLGGGHSIGVPIALASNYSFIAESATMTIHPIRLTGLVIGVPQTYEYLDKMQDRVVKFVSEHSNVTAEKFRELMFTTGELARDIGTVLVGPDAVRYGLINEVGGLSQAVEKLKFLIEQRKYMRRH